MDLIRLENVVKTYRVGEVDVPVLKGVSFSIRKGELVALMGASGSGKSTLMNILGCLDRPTSGHYWLDGQEVGGLEADERALVRTAKLGFVFQSFNLLSRTTAVNNVLMPLDYSPTAPHLGDAYERACELLHRVGLSDRLGHVPSQMSGGQQQRVAIARSLVNQPALLLADEPTGNLDSHTSVEILQMFQQLNEAGITIILVTHDPKVAGYAHRTIHVADGLVVEGTGGPGPHATFAAPGKSSNGNGPHSLAIHQDHVVEPPDARAPWARSDVGGTAVSTRPAKLQRAVAAGAAPAAKPLEMVKPASEADTLEHAPKPSFLSLLLPTTLRTAINALRRNKMRSALTTLGVVIGVGAVIAMVEISQGSRSALLASMSTMGANNLTVMSGAASSGGVSWGRGSAKTLSPEDAEEIMRQCPAVETVAPVVQTGGQVVRGNRNWVPMNIYGTTPSYLTVRDWNQMDDGDMFTEQDVRSGNKVCVIGRTLAKELFGEESPVGENIRIKNVSFRVLGVLGAKGSNMIGMDQDDVILAPWTAIKFRVSGNNATSNSGSGSGSGSGTGSAANATNPTTLYPGKTNLYPERSTTQQTNEPKAVQVVNVDQIQVKAASAEEIPAAIAQMTELLHERHRIRDDEPDDFTIRDMSEFLKMMTSTSAMMGGLLMIVAFISLAVGGIGIMNIMLVSVTERTREIGLRMAVGARSHHILKQFLIEAIVLCLFGGAMGIALGRAASLTVWYFMRWPVQASLIAIGLAFVVSATIGIAFGFYPAWKASRLDPIDALRYE
jgi:macrolide transport system ATP-binding/permease protein